MHLNLEHDVATSALLVLFVLKALATALTIGSGFTGGLFFASLLLGAPIGKALAMPMEWLMPGMLSPDALAIIGMSAFGVAVIGGPLTMTFLALEVTGKFAIGVLALATSMTSSLVARWTSGYWFSTWRFHLRGETIRSAHDVGWLRNLTVDRLMRRDMTTARGVMMPDEFRRAFLSAQRSASSWPTPRKAMPRWSWSPRSMPTPIPPSLARSFRISSISRRTFCCRG